jgi:hypothetical protein
MIRHDINSMKPPLDRTYILLILSDLDMNSMQE